MSKRFACLLCLVLTTSLTAQNAPHTEADALDGWRDVLEKKSDHESLSTRDKKAVVASLWRPYQAGHWDTLLENTRKFLTRKTVPELDAISQFLQANDKPSLAEIVSTARIQLVRTGVTDLPDATSVEAMLFGRHLTKLLDQEFEAFHEIDLMQEPLKDPQDFLAYRDLIWERHVQSNELNNAVQLARQGQMMRKSALERRDRRADAAVKQEIEEAHFDRYLGSIEDLRKDMDERALEVRVHRVNYAVEVLEDAAAGIKDRFFAAYVIGVDSETLLKELQAGQAKFTRPILLSKTLATETDEKLRRGNKAAGDLVQKSRLLFAGLHWWRRGRYGTGTEAFGLLKSQAAVRNAKLRLALMMSKTTPVPTVPSATNLRSVPQYPRRHLAFWAYEDRVFGKLTGSSDRVTLGQTKSVSYSALKNKHFDGTINGSFW